MLVECRDRGSSYSLGVLADARGFEVVFVVSGSLVVLAMGLVAATSGGGERLRQAEGPLGR